jgi:hypothetical protein
VPITIGVCAATAAARCDSSAAAVEKSTSTSALARKLHDIAAAVDAAMALPRFGYGGGERNAHPSFAADNADAGHGLPFLPPSC